MKDIFQVQDNNKNIVRAIGGYSGKMLVSNWFVIGKKYIYINSRVKMNKMWVGSGQERKSIFLGEIIPSTPL